MRTVLRPVLMDTTDTHRTRAHLTGTMARSGLAGAPLSGLVRGSGVDMATMAVDMGMAIATMIVIVAMAVAMRMAEDIGITTATEIAIAIATNTAVISVAMTTDVFTTEIAADGNLGN